MRWSALTLILVASLCMARSHCPDPHLTNPTIGGDTIAGSVWVHKEPLRFAKVRLFSSSGTTAWVGKTDKDGLFTIHAIAPGKYRLEVKGWGSTAVTLDPELDRKNAGPGNQTPAWYLSFLDDSCVGVGLDMN